MSKRVKSTFVVRGRTVSGPYSDATAAFAAENKDPGVIVVMPGIYRCWTDIRPVKAYRMAGLGTIWEIDPSKVNLKLASLY